MNNSLQAPPEWSNKRSLDLGHKLASKRPRLTTEPAPDGQEEMRALAGDYLSSVPVFLLEYKLGYGHNLQFSQDGGGFCLVIHALPDKLARIAYKFATSIHPSHAAALQSLMYKAKGHLAVQRMMALGEEDNGDQYTISALATQTQAPKSGKYYEYLQYLVSRRYGTAITRVFSEENGISEEEYMRRNPVFDGFTIVDSVEALNAMNNMFQSTARKGGPPDFIFTYIDHGKRGPKLNQPLWLGLFVRSLKHTWLLDLRKIGSLIKSDVVSSTPVTLAILLADGEVNKVCNHSARFTTAMYHHLGISPSALIDFLFMQEKVHGKGAKFPTAFDTIGSAHSVNWSWVQWAHYQYMHRLRKFEEGMERISELTLSPMAMQAAVYRVRGMLTMIWQIYDARLGIREELEILEEINYSVAKALGAAGKPPSDPEERGTRNLLPSWR
ncbi:hypothetical protein HYALB_00003890 [Hymenoscyphus albidus]|uniref:Uncharacterized protein n=1 Tax=Hymenoscyphus albidus TaxID=595503 RepID=A0A9N9M1D1_9HELO|nr:hypothetical protein HYALB_00003890 [Hymenoscyphus albidus]